MRGLIILFGALAIVASAGCAKKENASSQSTEQSAPSAQTTPDATHEAPAAGHAENEQVNTSGSIADIMGRAHHEENELSDIITSAQLKSVHVKAFAIRDLVVAAAGKGANSAASASGLDEHVKEVTSLASELDEAGDSGNLAKTKTLFAQLQVELKAIDKIVGTVSH